MNILSYSSCNTIVFILFKRIFLKILSLIINGRLDFLLLQINQSFNKLVCNIDIEMSSFLSDASDYYSHLLLSNSLSLPWLLSILYYDSFIFIELESFINHFSPIVVHLRVIIFKEFKFIL
jgi:hypothetical protein